MEVMRVSQRFMNGLNRKINLVFEWALVLLAFFLIRDPINYILFILFGVMQCGRYLNVRKDLGLKEWHFSFFLLSIYLGILGDNFFRFYYALRYYDKILHFFIPMGLTFIMIDSRLFKDKNFLTLIILGFAAIFEILEYLSDKLLGTTLQGVFSKITGSMLMSPIDDTLFDLLSALLGSSIVSITYLIYQWKTDARTSRIKTSMLLKNKKKLAVKAMTKNL